MTMKKHLALVTYNFAPLQGVGSKRVSLLAKGLSQLGYDVSVLTVKDPPGGEVLQSSLDEFEGLVNIYRAKTYEPMTWVHKLRKISGKDHQSTSDTTSSEKIYSQRLKAPLGFKRLVQSLFVPDEKISWAHEIVKLGKKLHQKHPIEVIISSGPPHSAHLAASKLSSILDVPYILDLRDPWYNNTLHNVKRTKLNKQLEFRTFESAHYINVVTPGLCADVAHRYPQFENKLSFLPNVSLDNEFAYIKPEAGPISVCYTGNFQGSQNLNLLYKALKTLVDAKKINEHDIQFIIVGPIHHKFKPSDVSIANYFSFVGPQNERDVRQHQAQSDVLLYVQGIESQYQMVLGSKFAEYLVANRPVLALCQTGSNALEEFSRLTYCIPANPANLDSLVRALEQLLSQKEEIRAFSNTEARMSKIEEKYLETSLLNSYDTQIKKLCK